MKHETATRFYIQIGLGKHVVLTNQLDGFLLKIENLKDIKKEKRSMMWKTRNFAIKSS